MKTQLKNEVLKRFKERFGREATVLSYAPGRVEVLGNHTDYNEGFVLSAAIDYGTFFAIAPNDSSDCRLVAGDIMREVVFPVSSPRPSDNDTWSNYCKGVVAGLLPHGSFDRGFVGLFLGDIPQGSGLSSSAALENATALAVAKLYSISLDNLAIAKIGQRAEHEFAGVKCGLLDQISSLYGKRNMLVKTDFRTLEVSNVPLSDDVILLVCNSNAKHALVDGAYNQRREDCEAAAKFFRNRLDHDVRALRDVSWSEWQTHRDELPVRIANRAAHPIGENERVLNGSQLLERNDLAAFGRLMFASHDSSVRYFENSCQELDSLVEIAKRIDGVLGARLSGGGFGGSVVVLVRKEKAAEIANAISRDYKSIYGKDCDVNPITPSQGAYVAAN